MSKIPTLSTCWPSSLVFYYCITSTGRRDKMRSECSCVRLSLRSNVIYDIPPPIGYLLFMCTYAENKGMHTDRKSKERDRELVELLSVLPFVPPRWGGVCVSVYRLFSQTACSRRRRVPAPRIWQRQLPSFSFFSLLLSSRLQLARILLVSRLF